MSLVTLSCRMFTWITVGPITFYYNRPLWSGNISCACLIFFKELDFDLILFPEIRGSQWKKIIYIYKTRNLPKLFEGENYLLRKLRKKCPKNMSLYINWTGVSGVL